MALAEVLKDLGPTDPSPKVIDLGGEAALREEVAELDAALLPRLVEAVAGDWESVEGQAELAGALVERLRDIEGPLSFASTADFLLAVAVVLDDTDVTRAFMDALLAVADDNASSPENALRAGHALRGAVDLALLDVGVSPHLVLAAIERLDAVPPEMASATARAVGRLWEHFDDPFLREQLERNVLPHEDAAPDGTVELGLKELRDAFHADDRDVAASALKKAVDLFDQTTAFDENRADARAYAAAARAVLAFGDRDGVGLTAALEELTTARAELDRYTVAAADGFRGAVPLRSVGAWHVLAATLRGLHSHLEQPDVLDLRPAVEALADAYGGMRLAILDDERVGLRAFIQPVIQTGVAATPVLAEGVAQLADEQATSAAAELAQEVVRPKVSTHRRRLRTSRRRP